MDSPIVLLTIVLLAVTGLALLIYLCCRLVLWAKKGKGGVEFLVGLVGSVDVGGALNPAHEIVQEKRRLKRSEQRSGDPDDRESQ
jgi:hypothetical protein